MHKTHAEDPPREAAAAAAAAGDGELASSVIGCANRHRGHAGPGAGTARLR